MGNIVLQGWEPGFKIALSRLLRMQFGYSLGEAKRLVDQVLEHRPLALALAVPECALADTRLALARIGVRVQKQEAAAAC